jgi:hypothetical protein
MLLIFLIVSLIALIAFYFGYKLIKMWSYAIPFIIINIIIFLIYFGWIIYAAYWSPLHGVALVWEFYLAVITPSHLLLFILLSLAISGKIKSKS